MYIQSQRRKFTRVFQVLHTFFLLSIFFHFCCVRKFWKAQFEKQPRSNGLDIVHNVNASKGPHMKRNVRWDNGVWRERAAQFSSAEKQERTIEYELCFGFDNGTFMKPCTTYKDSIMNTFSKLLHCLFVNLKSNWSN